MKKIRAKLRFYLKEAIIDNQDRLDGKNSKIQEILFIHSFWF